MGYYLGKGVQGKLTDSLKNLTDKKAQLNPDLGASALGGSAPAGGDLDTSSMPTYPSLRRQGWGFNLPNLSDPVVDSDEEQVEELGDWAWPAEMQGLFNLIQGRAGQLLNMTPGFSEEAKAEMFGRDFSKIRGAERGTRESVENVLADQGMLNTGTALEALSKVARDTEKNVGEAKQNVFLADEQQRRADLQLYNQLANDFFGSLMNYATTEEALNAARRGESNNMLALMLQYYLASQGSNGG